MKIGVVGVTGMVGQMMLKVLEERNFPVSELVPVASESSVGKQIVFKGKNYTVVSLAQAVAQKPDIALFSAGGSVSYEWAPKFAEVGTTVIDNSSTWRMEPDKKLIIPEVNGFALTSDDKIIANPNCSTIQLLMAMGPLHQKYGLKRMVISTYQSITGSGKKAVSQMENERLGQQGEMAYPYPIDKNCLPHCDVFYENGYTKEEMKLVNETRKILNDYSIAVSATAVRVPVVGGHSEAVNAEFEKDFNVADVRKLLSQSVGVKVQDNIDTNTYPMPRFSEGKDEVFVGRIRRDEFHPNTLNLWIVADNLRKGAATNTVQIAEMLIKEKV